MLSPSKAKQAFSVRNQNQSNSNGTLFSDPSVQKIFKYYMKHENTTHREASSKFSYLKSNILQTSRYNFGK